MSKKFKQIICPYSIKKKKKKKNKRSWFTNITWMLAMAALTCSDTNYKISSYGLFVEQFLILKYSNYFFVQLNA